MNSPDELDRARTTQSRAIPPAQRTNAPSSVSAYEFDVALSFAGEDRTYVRDVADALKARGIRVFYDEFEVVTLWGADLVSHLDQIYRIKSRFAVVFSSKAYAKKMWTSHERKSAQARALQEKGEYLLPVRLDDSEIPGIQPTIGYLDGRTWVAEQVASFIEEKLGADRAGAWSSTEEKALAVVPLTLEDERALVATRPPGWEYLLLAGGIWQAVNALEPKALDNELGIAPQNNNYVTLENLGTYVTRSIAEVTSLVSKIMLLLEPRAMTWALGVEGEPGDPTRIRHLCQRFAATYGEMLEWAANIRGTSSDDVVRRLLLLLADHANGPIMQIRDFADTLVMEVSKVPAHLANEGPGDEHLEITIALVLSIDPEITDALTEEFARLGRKGGR